MTSVEQAAPAFTGRQAWGLFWALVAALVAWMFFAVWPDWLNAVLDLEEGVRQLDPQRRSRWPAFISSSPAASPWFSG